MRKPLDKFSAQSDAYRRYRPTYPDSLYRELLRHTHQRNACWDCGTGNGQVAQVLAKHFDHVYATDISKAQIEHAPTGDNIHYGVGRAEKSGFPEDRFDLITVAQAAHWFDMEAFNQEARRVSRTGALVALWGYGLLRVSQPIDVHIDFFYHDIVGPYWNKERRHVESEYRNLPFDFEQVAARGDFHLEGRWNRDHLEGYLNSWSSVQNFKQKNAGHNPVTDWIRELDALWPASEWMQVRFPIFLRMGRVV